MSTPTAVRNAWGVPLKWLAAPSSASTYFSASLRASSLTLTSSPGISSPVGSSRLSVTVYSRSMRRVTSSPSVLQPTRPPGSPAPAGRAAGAEEGAPPVAEGERLRFLDGHPEHDRPHRPVHRVERPGVGEPEVLQDRPAFAAHAGQDQFPARAHREFLDHRLAVDGMDVGHGERLAPLQRVPEDGSPIGVREFEGSPRPEHDGSPPWICFSSSMCDASLCTATSSGFFSKIVFVIS